MKRHVKTACEKFALETCEQGLKKQDAEWGEWYHLIEEDTLVEWKKVRVRDGRNIFR